MGKAPFYIPAENPYSLMRGEQEIILGPAEEMYIFCRWLNADVPPDLEALRERLQSMIMVARGCSFVIGPGLKGNRS
jgi:hypothetical protein